MSEPASDPGTRAETEAAAEELDLRHRLADAVNRRTALVRKAERYTARSRLAGADPAVAEAAEAARQRAAAFDEEVEELRRRLREVEGRLARLDPDLQ